MSDTRSFKATARASARSLTQWPLLVVLGVIVVGLVFVMIGHWRIGTGLFGGGLGLGALFRAFLPRHIAGLLQVRGRIFDVAFLAGISATVIVLAFIVPTRD